MDRMPEVTSPRHRDASQPTRPHILTHAPAKAFVDVGTSCLRQGRYDEARFYLRESLRFQPDDRGTLVNLGALAWAMGRALEAEGYYRRALQLEPDDYSIVHSLGNLLWHQGSADDAARFFRRALELKPDCPEAWMNLGAVLTDLTQFDEAIACIQESLRLRPESHEAHNNLGATLARQGKWDKALASYDCALRLQPSYAEARRNRALAWLARGDFERGWPEFEWRLRCRSHVGLSPACPRWTGEDLWGRTILLHCELGLGDTIQLIRLVTEVRKRNAGGVVVICSKPLGRLIATCRGIDVVAVEGSLLPPFDVHASLWSLPAILGTTLANLPAPRAYLSVDSDTIALWRTVLARALGDHDMDHAIKVGIVWQGNPKLATDRERSFRLRELEPLARVPGVRLISLQKEHGLDQLRELGGRFSVAQLANDAAGPVDRRDFLDTAAIVSQLDLVITPDSAVAHLAGSLGARVWVALPSVAEWRWMLDREDSPWYPSMRLFRQTTAGDWQGVFARMAGALRRELTTLGRAEGVP
ncbi:MAG: tetratricopeptide repeat protein [Isosphaeraceae bacterium]